MVRDTLSVSNSAIVPRSHTDSDKQIKRWNKRQGLRKKIRSALAHAKRPMEIAEEDYFAATCERNGNEAMALSFVEALITFAIR